MKRILIENQLESTVQWFYLCPSPHMLIAAMVDLPFRPLRENPNLLPGINLLSELGRALEDYLARILPDLFPGAIITRIPEAAQTRRADFIIETETTIFVLECKRTLGDASSKTIARPEDAVATWNRLLDSYEQCAATVREVRASGRDNGRTVISIVVVGDNILGEQAVFDFLAYRSGILDQLGLQQIEALSLDSFERTFQFGRPREVAEAIIEKWRIARAQPSFDHFYSLQVRRRAEENLTVRALEDAMEELLPQPSGV